MAGSYTQAPNGKGVSPGSKVKQEKRTSEKKVILSSTALQKRPSKMHKLYPSMSLVAVSANIYMIMTRMA